MLFHTWEFGLFFVVVLAIAGTLRRASSALLIWLLTGSYIFYGSWNPYYLLLIVYSTLIDYLAVQAMDRWTRPGGRWLRNRRSWLIISIGNNLGLLGFFKYANFFIENINMFASHIGMPWRLAEAATLVPFGWEYLLPVGISFYTFQSLSYTIDFYRGRLPREDSLLRFSTYVAFFPQLVAGPIERSSNLLPQLAKRPCFSLNNVADGSSLFLVGLFKKVALANYLAMYVERVYAEPSQHSASALVAATFCFAWQIYFDFSGYTDMARGIARIMGYDLMLNFRNPYVAIGLSDFWARWHISLSTWFRDYLYIPLGGNRRGALRTQLNLLVVFVVSGFWHGSAWTFVIWGLLHGIGTIGMQHLERRAWFRDRVPAVLKQCGVFLFVCFAWIFFRAETLSDAQTIIQGIATGAWTDPACPLLLLSLVGLVWAYQALCESRYQQLLRCGYINVPLGIGMITYIVLCATGGGEFIYFQF